MLRKINHIGIAVQSIEATLPFYKNTFGMEFLEEEEIPAMKIKIAMLKIGESKIELLQPTSEDSYIAKFLEKNGSGIHHIAYETDDIDAEIEKLTAQGIKMIDEKPRCGAHGTRIAFIHPKSSNGVLTELCQTKYP